MNSVIFTVFLLVGALGYFSNIWIIVRGLFSQAPEIKEMTLWFIASAFGTFIPPLGAIVGLFYLAVGPTRNRSETRIDSFLNQTKPSQMVEWIDDQINQSQLWDHDWIKSSWLSLSSDEREEFLRENRRQFKINVRKYTTAFDHGNGLIYSDFVAALRKMLDSGIGVDRARQCPSPGALT